MWRRRLRGQRRSPASPRTTSANWQRSLPPHAPCSSCRAGSAASQQRRDDQRHDHDAGRGARPSGPARHEQRHEHRLGRRLSHACFRRREPLFPSAFRRIGSSMPSRTGKRWAHARAFAGCQKQVAAMRKMQVRRRELKRDAVMQKDQAPRRKPRQKRRSKGIRPRCESELGADIA